MKTEFSLNIFTCFLQAFAKNFRSKNVIAYL